MEKLYEKRLKSETVFQGRILRVRVDTVLLPDGCTSTREVVEYSGAVAIVPLTAEGEVVMVRQYRYPVGRELLEIPAGKIEEGEEPEACARRELEEETGFMARSWQHLGSFYSTPGFTSEKMHLFLAQDLYPGKKNPDRDEFLRVERLPLAQALELIRKGEIADAKSICGLLWVSHFLLQR
ncbi:NUDIX hydrolase [Ammonifex degensii KC4]|uniref:NUDIX hydrolase n=1 Tax=Ammonifex degensii (strain DSM 10501 / KC4) TaxID=429009 RepID=C9RBH2_AMMDK|nr:NUDIX hydrolase [Ammonifex degensii]ACX51599.1 NUDIX hydrolase [Ammonifex degensii KC4]